MRLISQDGTFDVPYDQVVIQRYSDGIYWLNKTLLELNREFPKILKSLLIQVKQRQLRSWKW